MRRLIGLSALLALGVSSALAANITGSVKGPDAKPFMAAFVTALNTTNKMTWTVLSNQQGHFHIDNLPAATYTISATHVRYRAAAKTNVNLAANGEANFDFTFATAPVLWSELNTYQGEMLLPKNAKHDLSKNYADSFFTGCMISCHSFQHRMAEAPRNQQGWTAAVKYMRDKIMEGVGGSMSEERVNEYAEFLTLMFGPNSAKGPEAEAFQKLQRPVDPRALNIVYVEYDFQPDRGQGPWSAVEDKDGMMWIPYYGRGNQVVKLNPATAELTRFRLGFDETAGIHSAVPAADGSVWFTEAAKGRLGRLDPKTGKIEEWDNPPEAGRKNGTHTVRVDADGNAWSSGGPMISKLDPRTGKWQHFDLGNTYGNVIGHNGAEWFTSFRNDGPIGRVSREGQLSKFYPPTKGKPQRLQVDENNIVWFTERYGGKMGRFDPETETFREFNLPGPSPSPYAIYLDRDHNIWYSSHEQDTLNRLDPKTGDVIEYPYPHSEVSMREMFMDHTGKIWYASSVNNKVGYWYFQ